MGKHAASLGAVPRMLTCAAALLLGALSPLPPGYPRSYNQIIADASHEGELVIYATADEHEVAELLAAFRMTYPSIRIRYSEIKSSEIYHRFVRESDAHMPGADVLWSPAMDLQIKLVNDGYAQTYASPEKPSLPAWAVWKNQAYGTTAEPLVIAYNTRLVPPGDVPRTRADLVRLLRAKPRFYASKVATYDPALSGVGFLYLTQDILNSRETWELVDAFGGAGATLHGSAFDMLDRLGSGRSLIGYNIIGSYALDRAAQGAPIGVVMPADYTLVMSRIALIPNEARHANAAKLFLDFILSRRGQALLARRYMTPVRNDVPPPRGSRPPVAAAQAIQVGPELLANLDQLRRQRFFAEWKRRIARSATVTAPR